ncbi:amidase [Stutzerimonas nitrititolerans]|uniref:amidase n=1 Tax=Stutzerimonas nitrititolerans TaxID=2482751 RepID=UPI00289A10A9|nr:amidase [Stutzerimonas nitrititolerans]
MSMLETVNRSELLQPGLSDAFVREGFGAPPRYIQTGHTLIGMRMGVKDVFRVQGLRIGGGTPAWGAQQPIDTESAPAVRLCLEAGAHWVGKTVTDELAYSLAGSNSHYGIPHNAAAPGRLAGGSSSGSAAAVAAGEVDFSLGTDAGGSCRLPASYCGIWGVRPTQGRLPGSGFELAPSFDTVGWFARSGADMASIHAVIAGESVPATAPEMRFLLLEDVLPVCDAEVRLLFLDDTRQLDRTSHWLPAGELPLAHWAQAHRVLAGAETWRIHGDWVTANGDALGAEVRARFAFAAQAACADLDAWQDVRDAATRLFEQLLENTRTYVLLPTVPGPAPWRDATASELQHQREMSQQLLCIAGLAGLPQVSFPWCKVKGAPVGLSVIGPRHADAQVLAAAIHCHKAMAQGGPKH